MFRRLSARSASRRLSRLNRLLDIAVVQGLVSSSPNPFAEFYRERLRTGLASSAVFLRETSEFPQPVQNEILSYINAAAKLTLAPSSSSTASDASSLQSLIALLAGRPGVVIALGPDLLRVALLLGLYELAISVILDEALPVAGYAILRDWETTFELSSDDLLIRYWPPEERLREERSGHFSGMSWETQLLYRTQIFCASLRYRTSELAVVEKSLTGPPHIDNALFARAPLLTPGQNALLTGGVISTLAGAISAGVLAVGVGEGPGPIALAATTLALIGLTATIHESLDFFNRYRQSLWVRPRQVFRLAFEDVLAANFRTIVALPTVLRSSADLVEVFNRLTHLCRDLPEQFSVAILADPPDQVSVGDARAANASLEELHSLFEELVESTRPRFHLLTRSLAYVAAEARWMAPGRKAEKVRKLCLFLLGTDAFERQSRHANAMRGADFIIVVDDDTTFEIRDLLSLVATAAHPLNGVGTRSGMGSRRSGLVVPFLENLPYPRPGGPLSGLGKDPLFDAFGTRPFAGRGLYDVRSYLQVASQIPTDRLLSHDVMEGSYLNPILDRHSRFGSDSAPSVDKRQAIRERWSRGDFQNLLLASFSGDPFFRRLPLFGWCLVLDNARRSILPAVQVLGLVGCGLLGGLGANMLAAAILGLPTICEAFVRLSETFLRSRWGSPWPIVSDSGANNFVKASTSRLLRLPVAAGIAGTAAWRAAYRTTTGRLLLDWQPSRLHERIPTYRAAPVIAAAVLVAGLVGQTVLVAAAGAVWLVSISFERARQGLEGMGGRHDARTAAAAE